MVPHLPTSDSNDQGAEALASALSMLEPLVLWCVRNGVGHGQLSRGLKLCFYEQAEKVLNTSPERVSDSALSLMSGLHRGDVAAFKQARQSARAQGKVNASADLRRDVLQGSLRISTVHKVLVHWQALGLPERLPFKSPDEDPSRDCTQPDPGGQGQRIESFSQLVLSTDRTTSQGFSPRLVLRDMQRQGLVAVADEQVILLGFGSSKIAQMQERIQHFVSVGRDFLSAGVANLAQDQHLPYLEQSLDGDHFSAESVHALHQMARQWSGRGMKTLGARAIELHAQDEPKGGQHRLRLGIYFYSEDMGASGALGESAQDLST